MAQSFVSSPNTLGSHVTPSTPGDLAAGFPPALSATLGPVLGTVSWFNVAKGYGFIATDTGEEVFVPFSAIQGEGLRILTDGQRVECELSDDGCGPRAAVVRTL